MANNYIRGSIWWTNLPYQPKSSVQSGYRPVVIVSSTQGCITGDIVMVCPITSKIKSLQVNVSIDTHQLERDGQVLTNQIVTVSKNHLSRPSGYLTAEEMREVEKGILLSLGIAKPVVDNLKANQEALISARKDREELEKLVPQGKEVINKLTELINRVTNRPPNKPVKSRTRSRLSPEEIESFISEWEDPHNRKAEVAEAFGFSCYNTAWNFYKTNKNKEGGR